MSVGRTATGRFLPGASGNPAGRPHRIAELQELVKTNFPAACRRLTKLLDSNDEDVAFKAIAFVFAYVLGKPPEVQDLLHVEQMRARLTELVIAPKHLPDAAALSPPQPPPAAAPSPSLPTEQAELLPPEAGQERTPLAEPSGLRCLHRGPDGRCVSNAIPGRQWCFTHTQQLLEAIDE